MCRSFLFVMRLSHVGLILKTHVSAHGSILGVKNLLKTQIRIPFWFSVPGGLRGRFWTTFGSILESFWTNFGIIWWSFLEHFFLLCFGAVGFCSWWGLLGYFLLLDG